MLDKQAIREIPVSPETPRFYSPIFLVAKESGSWRLILNLKAFNKFVVPPSFQMETLRTVMDCLGEAAQQRQNTLFPPLTEVAEFLENLWTIRHKGNPLAPSTFAGYRSAIAAIHQGFPDGSTVSLNTDLSTLLKGIFVVAARPRTLRETWDLPTVLKYLAGPPFEPLHAAPLKSVAIKTAFLIQLALGRRVSWVHSCRIDPSHLRW